MECAVCVLPLSFFVVLLIPAIQQRAHTRCQHRTVSDHFTDPPTAIKSLNTNCFQSGLFRNLTVAFPVLCFITDCSNILSVLKLKLLHEPLQAPKHGESLFGMSIGQNQCRL